MALTRTTYMTNVRNQMDAVGSARWSDTEVKTALGIISGEEFSGLLAANPYFKFAQRSVTTNSAGQFAYTGLNSGTTDTIQTWYRILAITDGNMVVYRQTDFQSVPLASSTNYDSPYERLWYDAGDNAQVLPVTSGLTLTVSVNWTPVAIDNLSGDSITYDFPAGHESIIWLGAAAFLLDKAGAETDAANVLRASAAARRQQMYQDLARRSAMPISLGYPDLSSDWSGF